MFYDTRLTPFSQVNLLDTVFGHSTYNLYQTDTGYEIRLDVPGYQASEIDIEVKGTTLVVQGASKKRGRFTEKFTLPKAADASRIEADLELGVLTVALPKAPGTEAKKIPVKSAGQLQSPPD